MHSKLVSDYDGTFREAVLRPDKVCPSCKKQGYVEMKIWDSNCGGFEDLRFECKAVIGGCGRVFWVDGDDG